MLTSGAVPVGRRALLDVCNPTYQSVHLPLLSENIWRYQIYAIRYEYCCFVLSWLGRDVRHRAGSPMPTPRVYVGQVDPGPSVY